VKIRTALLGGVLIFLSLTPEEAQTPVAKNLTPSGFGSARQPQVAVSPQGEIYVVFVKDSTIYLVRSTDHGENFSDPAKVADVPGLMAGMRRGPRIAVAGKRLLVSAPAKDLMFFLSEDNGKTWTPPLVINDQRGSAAEGLQNITALPDGNFYAVWLDSRSGGKQIEGARMEPGAASWGANVTVYKSPEKSVCECCHPSVVSDAKGKMVVMWRNSLAGNRDFYLAESTDRGDTFSAAIKLGTGEWKLNACPMDGGSLVATEAGVFTIWRRMNEVYLDQPGQPEIKIADGTQPVMAQVSGQLICAWQQQGKVVVAGDAGRAQLGSFPGAFPSMVASPGGKEAYLVWESSEGDEIVPKFAIVP